MKLREYIKRFDTPTPDDAIVDIGHLLSEEHLKLTGERPQKTPEIIPLSKNPQMTNEYPEWFLERFFDQILEQYITNLQHGR